MHKDSIISAIKTFGKQHSIRKIKDYMHFFKAEVKREIRL